MKETVTLEWILSEYKITCEEKSFKRVMVTGHRPNKIGGYNKENYFRSKIRNIMRAVLNELEDIVPIRCVTGMAIGSDQDFAEVCYELDIPYDAYVPFDGQEMNWPNPAKEDYYRLLDSADDVIKVNSGSYSPKKMKERNIAMVDSSDLMICVWDGQKSGGTYHTIDYNRRSKKIPSFIIKV